MASTVLFGPSLQDDFIYFNLDQLATLSGGAAWLGSSGPFAIDTTAQIPYGSCHYTQGTNAYPMIASKFKSLADDERSHRETIIRENERLKQTGADSTSDSDC